MHLMETEYIGRLKLENRLVMLATHLGYCEEGFIPRKLIEFYAERAKYRPGLIIVGGCFTEHLGMSLPNMIGISKDEYIEGLTSLVDTIHEYGVPIAAQLYHAGRYANSIVLGEQSVSASEVASRLTKETPRALTLEEVHQTVRNFGAAAARAKKAGFDAVEILGSAGYLINQFLAEVTNKRADEYGGTLESRARFPLEIIESVRTAVGKRFPVIYRMSGEDFVEGGLTQSDNKSLAPRFERAGVDAFNVTGGWHETRIPQITMDVPRGHYAYLAEGIAETVGVPVVACNRINSLSVAERILSRGKARLIGMSRGLIADPELPEKIRTGEPETIRSCIGCNLGCLDRVFLLGPVTCAINAQAGYESTRGLRPQGQGKIAVVGAGPAGMEVSRVLRQRGFEVTLFEKDTVPGGLLRLAARVPGRGEFATYVSFMWREMRRLGVDLRLGRAATVHDLSSGFDFVVCSTGTIPTAPPIEGVESAAVMTAHDVLENPPDSPGKALVIGGDAVGCYVALFLSQKAEEVHIIERSRAIGTDLGRTTRWVILKALKERNVVIHTGSEVSQVTGEYIITSEEGDVRLISGSLMVMSSPPEPRNRLFQQLSSLGVPCAAVGTSERPMDLLETVHRAYEFANGLDLQ